MVRPRQSYLWLCGYLAVALALASCGGGTATPSRAQSAASGAPDPANWDAVLKEARGQTVNWYMYGGAESINRFVDTFYGKALPDRYGITLKRVPVADTVDAVNQVLSEKEAGKDPGAVDLIWINGANFFTLKQAAMLHGGWAGALPNSRLVNRDNPAVNLDFGQPIGDLESPWSSAQFQFIYDAARTDAGSLPRSYAGLKDWACAHPGRFTYIAPGVGAFQGTRFVKGALYEISGGGEQWLKYDQALWDRWSPQLWEYLTTLKPCLWRQGATYPKDENELHQLFANQEVDFSITQAVAGAGTLIQDGLVPSSARAFVFDRYMIGDFNYVAIPKNAPHKAAALVLANLLLEPELQAAQILPENGFGLGYGIDVSRVTDPAAQRRLQEAAQRLGPAATPPERLSQALAGDTDARYQELVEQEWRKRILSVDNDHTEEQTMSPRRWDRIGPWLSLVPALTLTGLLFGTAVTYGVAQSLGYLTLIDQRTLRLNAYRDILAGDGALAREFWAALGFSLWISVAATLLSAVGALALVLLFPQKRADRLGLTVLHLNLAFPHLVWAIALLLLLGQSGLLARLVATLGLIGSPAEFPVLVRDRFGLGIIIHYVTKETPFLTLIVLGILRAQPEAYDAVAANLGAGTWQRLRHVTLPLVLPGLTAGALLVFAFTFGAYEVPAILGVRYPRMLAVVALDLFMNSDLRLRAAAMAVSVVMAATTIVIAVAGRAVVLRRAI